MASLQSFLVAGEAGVEDDLAGGGGGGRAKTAAWPTGAVLEDEQGGGELGHGISGRQG